MDSEDTFRKKRESMLAEQIERRGLHNPRVLQAMLKVPRHHFIPKERQGDAYKDGPLPIGEGQTISQPYIVALMTSLLNLRGFENVLEIGTGSGYQAAVLGELACSVHSIERHKTLAESAVQRLSELGYSNISVHHGDGSLGWVENAPYHGILVTAAAPRLPHELLHQLVDGGVLVSPVGGHSGQDLQVWTRVGSGFDFESILPVAFVPLRGALGWQEDDWEEFE
jgi:protein-L-isoaspartate(D-aspartate) O-methyltransferase